MYYRPTLEYKQEKQDEIKKELQNMYFIHAI